MAEVKNISDSLEALNKEARAWLNVTEKKLKMRLLTLGLHDRLVLGRAIKKKAEEKLEESIYSRLKNKHGALEALTFSFARHGIFLEHGVGKNRPIRSPFVNPKPWLKPVLEPALENLANILAERYADVAAGELRLRIPGIVDTRTNTAADKSYYYEDVDNALLGIVNARAKLLKNK